MVQSTMNERLRFAASEATRKLLLKIDRSPGLRSLLLALLNIGGYLLMSAPLLALVATGGSALQLIANIRGPFDWFLAGVCSALALATAFACYRLYSMKPAEPGGINISESDAPELFAMLERRLAHFNGGRLDAVRFGGEAELLVAATPRSMLPLLHRHTLVVGAALMFFINASQFRLALAGAIAAHARVRRSPRAWLLQSVQDWRILIDTLDRHPCQIASLLLPALHWIAARCNQLSKDIDVGSLQAQTNWVLENTDEETSRELLSRQILAAAYLARHYWPMLLKSAEQCPDPVVRPFGHFDLLLQKTFTGESARRWLLQAQAGSDRSVEELRDILAETGIEYLAAPELVEHSAFDSIFRSREILKQLDRHWQSSIAAEWSQRHSEYQAEKNRFDQLLQRSEQQDLRGDSAINFVRLAARFMDKAKRIVVLRKTFRANTDDPRVCFICGEAMLASGHALEGCDALQRAAELDGKLANRAHALISQNKQSWLNRKSRGNELALVG